MVTATRVAGKGTRQPRGAFGRGTVAHRGVPATADVYSEHPTLSHPTLDVPEFKDSGAKARFFDQVARQIDDYQKRSFLFLGKVCREVRDGELWRHLARLDGSEFETFDQWLADALTVSRSGAYEAMRTLDDLAQIPEATLEKVPRRNLSVLRRLPGKTKFDPEIIEAAQNKSEIEFRKYASERIPDAHIEVFEPMKLEFTMSQRKAIDEFFEVAAHVMQTNSREDMIEIACLDFLERQCEAEGFTHLTNREWYEQRTMTVKGKAAHA